MMKKDIEKILTANNTAGIYTDTARVGNPGYETFITLLIGKDKMKVLLSKNLYYATSEIAEFLSIVETLIFCKLCGIVTPVYSKSLTAINWVKNKVCKMKPRYSCQTELVLIRIEAAECWLKDHDYPNPVLKYSMTPEIQSAFNEARKYRVF